MDYRAVGVFDSGVGGLSAVRVLRRILPGENIVYLADTANVPYGGRSVEELRRLASASTRRLMAEGVKAILVACGTVSSNCLEVVGEVSALPYCGVVLPTARMAAETTKNGRVGVLSTEATARSGAFSRAISALAPGTAVLETGTGLLVPLAESGRTDYSDAGVREAVRTSLSPLLGSGIDTLVLGCTHFPLLAGAIGEAAGPGVELVNSGAAGAMECARLLEGGGLLCGRDSGGTLRCLVSGDEAKFARDAKLFLPDESAIRVEKA